MSNEVFISYSSHDSDVANQICAAVEESGTLCWIAPRDVMPGESYGEALIDAINSCRVMVLVLSLGVALSERFGLVGMGIAWLVAEALVAVTLGVALFGPGRGGMAWTGR